MVQGEGQVVAERGPLAPAHGVPHGLAEFAHGAGDGRVVPQVHQRPAQRADRPAPVAAVQDVRPQGAEVAGAVRDGAQELCGEGLGGVQPGGLQELHGVAQRDRPLPRPRRRFGDHGSYVPEDEQHTFRVLFGGLQQQDQRTAGRERDPLPALRQEPEPVERPEAVEGTQAARQRHGRRHRTARPVVVRPVQGDVQGLRREVLDVAHELQRQRGGHPLAGEPLGPRLQQVLVDLDERVPGQERDTAGHLRAGFQIAPQGQFAQPPAQRVPELVAVQVVQLRDDELADARRGEDQTPLAAPGVPARPGPVLDRHESRRPLLPPGPGLPDHRTAQRRPGLLVRLRDRRLTALLPVAHVGGERGALLLERPLRDALQEGQGRERDQVVRGRLLAEQLPDHLPVPVPQGVQRLLRALPGQGLGRGDDVRRPPLLADPFQQLPLGVRREGDVRQPLPAVLEQLHGVRGPPGHTVVPQRQPPTGRVARGDHQVGALAAQFLAQPPDRVRLHGLDVQLADVVEDDVPLPRLEVPGRGQFGEGVGGRQAAQPGPLAQDLPEQGEGACSPAAVVLAGQHHQGVLAEFSERLVEAGLRRQVEPQGPVRLLGPDGAGGETGGRGGAEAERRSGGVDDAVEVVVDELVDAAQVVIAPVVLRSFVRLLTPPGGRVRPEGVLPGLRRTAGVVRCGRRHALVGSGHGRYGRYGRPVVRVRRVSHRCSRSRRRRRGRRRDRRRW
ncbi:hypothetical protein [Streptomyces viridosporus]|uniref:hypothetical protein n=1 Tax=Streptomyces viridosporus TaxID=67581 RepID=UPI00168D4418|nr:hypothetical protein [Streptomyces viridosporus]